MLRATREIRNERLLDGLMTVMKLHILKSTFLVLQGASGAPMQSAGNTYGVASFGSAAGCEAGYPSVFTRVFYFLNWIEAHTGVTP